MLIFINVCNVLVLLHGVDIWFTEESEGDGGAGSVSQARKGRSNTGHQA